MKIYKEQYDELVDTFQNISKIAGGTFQIGQTIFIWKTHTIVSDEKVTKLFKQSEIDLINNTVTHEYKID